VSDTESSSGSSIDDSFAVLPVRCVMLPEPSKADEQLGLRTFAEVSCLGANAVWTAVSLVAVALNDV